MMLTIKQLQRLAELERLAERKRREKESEQHRLILVALILFFLISLISFLLYKNVTGGAADEPEIETEAIAQRMAEIMMAAEPDEAELIDAALAEQGYFRDDIPLTYEEQDFLHTACEEFGVEYALALAVIRQETDFRNVTGDDGSSAGYMQVQKRWHRDRMDRLGVTDLSDPYGNFRVGCSFLAELMGRYGNLTDALTAYNTGGPGRSGYAESVLAYMDEYLKEVTKLEKIQ